MILVTFARSLLYIYMHTCPFWNKSEENVYWLGLLDASYDRKSLRCCWARSCPFRTSLQTVFAFFIIALDLTLFVWCVHGSSNTENGCSLSHLWIFTHKVKVIVGISSDRHSMANSNMIPEQTLHISHKFNQFHSVQCVRQTFAQLTIISRNATSVLTASSHPRHTQ